MKGTISAIVNQSKRSGDKPKPDGTVYHWNIMTVRVETEHGEVVADSFDKLEIGDSVTVTKNEQYNSYNAQKATAKDAKLDEILDTVKRILKIVEGGQDEPLDFDR